ncbi:MAG: serine/threonine-protein kinase [Polyangiaceae bacterium]
MSVQQTIEAGERIGRYKVICELASGGMATVYLAYLGGLGGFQRLVAIKRLHPHLSEEKEFVNMFLDEARLVAEIRHPHVVPTLDIDQTPQGLCLVMEYVEGGAMSNLLVYAAQHEENGRVDAGIAIRIVLDALGGLHAAHELTDADGSPRGLVHRDVSPQNILVGTSGNSMILDFGIARASQRLTSTRVGQMKGKLAYMAPEQATGKEVDRRADVFAAGIVLWEALTGRRLFRGSNEVDTLTRLLNDRVPPLREIEPSVPEELEAAVMMALEREPDDRYPTCADFAEALEKTARKLDSLASRETVASYCKQVLGDSLEGRQSLVREALTRDSSLEPAPDSTEALEDVSDILEVRELPDQAPERGRWMFAFIGVAALGVVAVLFGVKSCNRGQPEVAAAMPTVSAPVETAPATAPPPEPKPEETAAASASAAPSAAPSASAEEVEEDKKKPRGYYRWAPAAAKTKEKPPEEKPPEEKPTPPPPKEDPLFNPYR